MNLFLFPSDNEEDRASQNGPPSKSEFKDEEDTDSNNPATQAAESTSNSSFARKRGGIPTKTVDLGAAAHYTGDKNSPDADNARVIHLRPNHLWLHLFPDGFLNTVTKDVFFLYQLYTCINAQNGMEKMYMPYVGSK